ncbi:hypothetical protein, partial [Staphylococcus aureus]|uniref:hypothetical protein n=1 Tax=Staphylococcus aureus TaxID=1280 RepID=UPI0039BE695E
CKTAQAALNGNDGRAQRILNAMLGQPGCFKPVHWAAGVRGDCELRDASIGLAAHSSQTRRMDTHQICAFMTLGGAKTADMKLF